MKIKNILLICTLIFLLSFFGTKLISKAISEENSYLVCEYEGNIGVFDENFSVLEFSTEIPVSSLRKEDRKLLEKGISAPSREAMLMLLEDLGS